MKRTLIALTLATLATGAFAADGYDRTPGAHFNGKSAPQAHVVEDGFDRTPSARVAEDGYDRTPGARFS